MVELSEFAVPAAAAAYVTLLVLGRWWAGWKGFGAVAVTAALVLLATGTVAWARPHQDVPSFRHFDWPCHATGGLPSIILLAASTALMLKLLPRARVRLSTQLGGAGLAAAAVAAVALMAEIYWFIMVLNCDTL